MTHQNLESTKYSFFRRTSENEQKAHPRSRTWTSWTFYRRVSCSRPRRTTRWSRRWGATVESSRASASWTTPFLSESTTLTSRPKKNWWVYAVSRTQVHLKRSFSIINSLNKLYLLYFFERTLTIGGKYHCKAYLLFDWFGFDQTSQAVTD